MGDDARLAPQQDRHGAVGRDIDDEPQMVDRNAVHQAAPTELTRHPVQIAVHAAGPVRLVARLDPRLQRHQRHRAEQQGRDQPGEPGAGHLTRRSAQGHEPQGCAGHQEQQRQPPWVGDQDRLAHPLEGVGAVHVPAIDAVHQADVIQDQQGEGAYADPVQIIATRRRGGRRGHGRVYDPLRTVKQAGEWSRLSRSGLWLVAQTASGCARPRAVRVAAIEASCAA